MRHACVVPAVGFALLFASRSASAFERQQHFGLDAGGAVMTTSGTSQIGVTLGMHYTYGLTDAINLAAEGGWSGFTTGGATGPQPGSLAYAGVGALYVFDVLRWVPYAGVLIGGAYFGGGAVPSSFVTLDAQLAVGLDYAVTRSWSVGGAYRQHMFLTQTSTYPEYSALMFRAEYVWGW